MKRNLSNKPETVSVIICTARPNQALIQALNSVHKCSTQPHEIIVIDQSDEGTNEAEIIRNDFQQTVKWFKHRDKGLSKARNFAINVSSGSILAFTDDDAYVDEGWIDAIIESFNSPDFNTGIAGGKILPIYHERDPKWKTPKKWEFVLPAYEQGEILERYRYGLPPGVNYSVKRTLFDELGGFDENIGVISGRKTQIYGEDSDFTIRATNAGYHIVYNPRSIVYHPVPLSRQSKKFLKKRLFVTGLTKEYLRKKHSNFSVKKRFINAMKENLVIRNGVSEFEYNWCILSGRIKFLFHDLMQAEIK